MPFAAALSHHPLAPHATGEVVGQVLDALGDRPDAAVLFVTGGFAGAIEDIAGAVRATLRPGALVGSTARAVLAGGGGADGSPAVALFAMRFGPPRRFVQDSLARVVTFEAGGERPATVTASCPVDEPGSTLIVLGDPFTFPAATYLRDLSRATPGLRLAGGLASLGGAPSANVLVADESLVRAGAVGLVLPPAVTTDVVVSQGCQPVGEPLVVTRSSGAMIEEIAGTPALDRLLDQAAEVEPGLRRRMSRSLHVGLVLDEHRDAFGREDFLVRPVLGADKERRAISVGSEVAVGTTIQFQVRDAESVREDLQHALRGTGGDGALVFAGSERFDLTGDPSADATAVHEQLGGGASAGMSSVGEIGPVGEDHLLHATSASVVRFFEPSVT